jgi:hypothetical protein
MKLLHWHSRWSNEASKDSEEWVFQLHLENKFQPDRLRTGKKGKLQQRLTKKGIKKERNQLPH